MKLNIIAGLMLALLLLAGTSSHANAQEWRWHRWGGCGYCLCKEDTAGMSKRVAGCHYCNPCCYHRGWGWGWGWRARCCGGYYYESLHKDGHHECNKDGKKDGDKDCHYDGHRGFHHWDSCCGYDRYYYRGGGY